VLPAGDPTVPLNSCYVIRTAADIDAQALHALLSSPLVGAWLDTLAEPARGGFRRFLGWTVATLPVPQDWNRARVELARLSRRMTQGERVTDDELTQITARCYGVAQHDVQPLLDWHKR
jgi:hypothetical protein